MPTSRQKRWCPVVEKNEYYRNGAAANDFVEFEDYLENVG
jgi:hypothetical protein